MGAFARLSLAAGLGLSACSGEAAVVAVPAFAEALPGRTAVAVWGDAGLPDDLVVWIERLAEPLRLERVDVPGALALRASERVEVGWKNLAESASFHRALALLDPESEHQVYLDCQLLVESASLFWPEGGLAMRERLTRALVLRGFDSAIVGLRRRGDGWEARGTVLTSGAPAGLPGLLTVEVDRDAVAPEPERGCRLQLETLYDPAVAQRIFETLVRTGDRRSMFGSALAGPARLFDDLVAQVDGRVSVTLHGSAGLCAAARVRDPEEMSRMVEDLVDQFAGGAPLVPRVERSGDWVALRLPGSPPWKPPPSAGGERIAGPFLWGILQLPERIDPDERRLVVRLQRRAPDRIGVELAIE